MLLSRVLRYSEKINKIFLFVLFAFSLNANAGSVPKNIIILIGDGMGVNYVSASVLSLHNDPYKRFDISGFSVTVSADKLVTDSGAGATALASGYRVDNLVISLHPDTNEPLLTLLDLAVRFNKSTGIVVTSSVTHATPAAFISNVNNRREEIEIAKQLSGRSIDVVIGGGTKFFTPRSSGGDRKDDLNLIDKVKNSGYSFYDSYEMLLNSSPANKFYALFAKDGLPPAAERNYSLGNMTKIAIDYLKKQQNGFVLMVEGSQIDWAGHANNQQFLLNEMKDFNEAIIEALNFAEEDGETLVLVTADHETGGMSIVEGNRDGSEIKLRFNTGHHTAEMVPVFAKGPGAEQFSGINDNYIIGRKLFRLIDSGYQFK
jgi:alkaline phosphatase